MGKKTVYEGLTRLCRARPCMMITTLHEDGTVNAGTFGAYTNVGPREIGIAIGMTSHTYANIKRTGEFVINVPDLAHASALEICGEKLDARESELDHCGLGTEPAAEITTPIVVECVANIECRFWRELEIGHHSFVIGKAVAGHIDERFIDKDGGLDVVKAKAAFAIRYPDPLYAVLDHVTVAD